MHESDITPDITPGSSGSSGSFDSPDEAKSNREIHQHLKAIRDLVMQDQPSEDHEELKQSFALYLRQEVDKLRVGASIAQNRLDLLTKASRMMLITVAGIGILSQLYQLVADAALLTNLTEQDHSSALVVVVPPAVLNALSTLLVIVLKQLGVVERASELAVVKRDADVVVAKMTSLEHSVSNVSTRTELDELHAVYGGELTTLKTDVSSKLNTHLRQEDQAKLASTYRRIMLSDLADTADFERIRRMIVGDANTANTGGDASTGGTGGNANTANTDASRQDIEAEIQAFGRTNQSDQSDQTSRFGCCECLAAL
jgi:hypothetical protein